MITAEAAVRINRCAEEVFAAVAEGDAGNEARWHLDAVDAGTDALSGRPTGPEGGVWDVFSSLGAGHGAPGDGRGTRITALRAGRLLELEASAGAVRQAICYQFEEDGGATRCRRAVALEAGLSPGEERAVRPRLEAANQARLEVLKAALEGGPPTAAAAAAAGLGQVAGAGGTV